MKHLLAFIFALLLASLCGITLHAQGITKIAFPFPGHHITAALTGQQDGVLVHGTADTTRNLSPDPDVGLYETSIFPYVFESDAAGAIRTVHLPPDTGRGKSGGFGGNRVDMHTAAVADGTGRIVVAWSSQKVYYSDDGSIGLEKPTLSVGQFENGVFRLLVQYDAGSNPQLLRDTRGIVHLVWATQKAPPAGWGGSSSGYSEEVQYASFRNGVPLSSPVNLGSGMLPQAVLDAADAVHIVSVEYDSLPSPVFKLKHIAGGGSTWANATTLAEAPAWLDFPHAPFWFSSMPRVLAFAADRNGVARLVLQQTLERGGDSLLALSSEGGGRALDVTKGTAGIGTSWAIDANGTLSAAFIAPGRAQYPSHGRDSLFLCIVDPALTAPRFELLTADTLGFNNLQLLQTKNDGLCLAFSRRGSSSLGTSAWLFTRLGTGLRTTRLLADGFGSLLQHAPAASDSSGAIWLAHSMSSPSDEPFAWLWRIPPGAVPVERVDAPDAFALQCFPNPATTDAAVRFNLPTEQSVTITVHDLLGREVLRAVDGQEYPSGTHLLPLRVADFARGVYSVRLSSGKARVWTTIIVR